MITLLLFRLRWTCFGAAPVETGRLPSSSSTAMSHFSVVFLYSCKVFFRVIIQYACVHWT
ncbi:hypothetical protein ID866_9803 [Astraeus odoratus]|nr:hypothetical protein ID866_9803 [Astraeus odoratus]